MYNVIDIFSGGGGFGLGFRQAGFKIRVALDVDRDAVRTYSANHVNTVVLQRDIREVSYEDLVKYGEADVLIGSPPCEPFTSANPNRMEDPADRLYLDPAGQLTLEFIRIVGELRPKIFVMENVAALAEEPLRSYIEREFRRVGYEVYFNVLHAEDYGVPSRRRRVFVSNVEIRPPKTRIITVREALRDLPPPDSGLVPNHDTVTISMKKQYQIARLRPGEALMKYRGATGFYENYIRLRWDEVAPTVMGTRRFVHPEEHRVLTVREQARLMGYPDSYTFFGSKDSQYNQVGESVPPPLAYAIALEIRKYIDEKVYRRG
ncbi:MULTISPECIES: DNA cytosine methyltransferase [Pyrobaculum]|uniref:DNA (cytosine-5-)-methyltransferase n=2 Tax=Pyrobaculum arsenaticum TaxID=121277 RepID=A4WLX3_PYRAR|nr:DNA cytosine methyltransferase [Pyrobaculum arsenaticum]ABP51390.1 DNA-cytosine methyltransferase [Pyrobaculum arsenaticum DSM 13514]MCY0890671.1 DNA cytosine methyltransferase [Pyrobaculum arsenaticum]NYR16240.1 DNA cytosine methyltransferase [Pyrobaculum arsenaticum]